MISDLGPKYSKTNVFFFQIGPLGKKTVEIYNDLQMDKQFYFHKFMNHEQLMLLRPICGSLGVFACLGRFIAPP